MKNYKLILIVPLLISVTSAFSQADSDFIIIDEIADNLSELKSEFSDRSNLLVTEGFSPNAIQQISNSVDNLQINDLQIYVLTKQGAIVFNSIALTPGNQDEWSEDLKAWSKNVTGKVIIHSEVVFTGEEGILLKQQLEEISGLVFTTQN